MGNTPNVTVHLPPILNRPIRQSTCPLNTPLIKNAKHGNTNPHWRQEYIDPQWPSLNLNPSLLKPDSVDRSNRINLHFPTFGDNRYTHTPALADVGVRYWRRSKENRNKHSVQPSARSVGKHLAQVVHKGGYCLFPCLCEEGLEHSTPLGKLNSENWKPRG